MNTHPYQNIREAYQLFHDGTLALSRIEQQGMRVDVKYIDKEQKKITKKVGKLEKQIKQSDFFADWKKAVKGKAINLHSPQQLGTYLYDVLDLPKEKLTDSGQGATDVEALMQLNLPELETLIQVKKLMKMRDTYLEAYKREQVGGVLRPFFNLNGVKSFRSCIAKDSKVLMPKHFLKYPNGVPIQKVKKGDFVYCFDDWLRPSIKKVLWAGKTGHREVIRIHWTSKGGGGSGYLDCTPEHKIRLINGDYVEAQHLIGDFRSPIEARKKLSKISVLSCKRNEDKLNFTGHLTHGKGILEHRFIYSQLKGTLGKSDVIHHKDGVHLNHTPSNLEKTTKREHAKYHFKDNLNSKKSRKKNRKVVKKKWKEGEYDHIVKRGADNPLSLNLSKFSCLKLLIISKGKPTLVGHDFDTYKKYCEINEIPLKEVMQRFDVKGKYISKHRLTKMHKKFGINKCVTKLGCNYYKLKRLYEYYGIPFQRKWGNQFGEFKSGNHEITKVEWIKKKVDVYDLEVEGVHNFIVNEICVHNSSQAPNLQNVPKRDKEAMNTVRRALYPRKGHQLLELDYGQLEVRIAACYHQDPTMLKYINDPTTDMHRDMAMEIFKIKKYKHKDPTHSVVRASTKNGFVFPQFYGDYYKNCASNIAIGWCKLHKTNTWATGDGIEFGKGNIGEHLVKQNLTCLNDFESHLQRIERNFWGKRFPVYDDWKEEMWQFYLKHGFVESYSGFTYGGVMRRNEVINYPVQGAAFHVLLKAIILGIKAQVQERWKSRLIGETHDSVLIDAHPKELKKVIKVMKCIMESDVRVHFPWITIPLEIDAELCPVDAPWSEKEDYKI